MNQTETTPKQSTINLASSGDYGTLQNDYEHHPVKAEENTRLQPRSRLLLTVIATLFAGTVLVILVVYVLSIGHGSGSMIGFNVESEELWASLNLTDRERAVAILTRVPLIDGHSNLPDLLRVRIQNKLGIVDFSRDVTEQWGFSQSDIPRMRQGMLGAQFWAAYPTCGPQGKDAIRVSLEQIDLMKRFVAQYPDTFTLVTTAQGVLDTFERGKIASLVGMEGGQSIDSSLATLRMFYDLGVRYMTLTHTCNTPWAESTGYESFPNPIPSNGGITAFGMMVVKEMNRLGMIIDLSHASDNTRVDTLNVTTAPVIFSHSAAWELCNHTFNLKDDILQMVPRNGGIVMVNFAIASRDCNGNQVGNLTVTSVADHIDYIHTMAGSDHVGLGASYESDRYYDSGTWKGDLNAMDPRIEDVSHYPELFTELASRGWTDEDLEKLAGRNFLRVFSAVEEERNRLSSLVKPFEELIPQADLSTSLCRSDL